MTVTSTSHVPERTCVGCRGKVPRVHLLRLVLDDGGLAVDPRASRPGRGAWIHPDLACLELAERRNALGRALRTRGPLDAAPVRDWLCRQVGEGACDTGPSGRDHR